MTKAYKCYPGPLSEVGMVYGDIEFPTAGSRDGRLPYVFMNMVSSLDGRVSSDGKSGSIGGSLDRATMRVLRSKSDAVAIGAGTMRAERVSLTSEGISEPEPKAVIFASNLNDLPVGNFTSIGEQKSLIAIPDTSDRRKVRELEQSLPEDSETLISPSDNSGRIDFHKALSILKASHGIRRLLVEGGPGVNNALVSESLVDEVFLTISPKILGGSPEGNSLGILSGELENPPGKISLSSIHVSHPEGEVFLRYKLR